MKPGPSESHSSFSLHPSHQLQMRNTVITIVLLTLGVVVAWALPPQPETRSIASYLPLLTLLETVSVVIAMLVFTVGWNAYRRGLPGNILLLACAFLGVGMLDFTHTISYSGMPDFVTPSSPEKAIDFWLAARSLAAIALLIVSITPWRPIASAAYRYILLATALILTGGLHWLFLFHDDLMPRTFIPGQGLTPFKIFYEYALVALYLATAFVLWMRMRKPLPFNAAGLFGAVCMMALSEYLFTLYADVNDIYNLLGHIYKAVSYLFLYRAVFVETIELPFNQLQNTKNQLRFISDHLPFYVAQCDSEKRYKFANQSYAGLFGLQPSDIIGKHPREILGEAAYAIASPNMDAALSGKSNSYDLMLPTPHGPREVTVNYVPERDAAGRVVGFIAAIADITERKQAEVALQESEARLRNLIDGLGPTTFVGLMTTDGTLIEANKSSLAAAGLEPADVMGMPFEQTYWWSYAETVQQQLRAAIESAAGGEGSRYDVQLRVGENQFIDIDFSLQPLRDETGKVVFLVPSASVITERKLAEMLRDGQQQVLEMIAVGASLPDTLTTLIRVVEAQSPGMLGSILLLDEDGIHVRHIAAPSLPAEFVAAIDGQPIGPCAGSCGTAAYRKEAVYVEDIATDPLWANYKAVTLAHGLHACWSTPIFDAQRQVLGTFAMYYRQPGLPQTEHRWLIDTVTHIAAIAISHHQAERVLRNSECRVRNIIDGLGPSIFVGLLTTEGVVLEANQQALAVAGLKPEDVLGKPVEETYWFSYSEESKRQMRETIARAARGEASRYDVQIRVAENQFIPLDFSVQPFRDATGRVVSLVPSAIVITERKRTEESLRESEAKFRAIIESSPVAMAMNDEHGNITLLDRKFIETFGYTQADIPTLKTWWLRAYPDPAYRQHVAQEWQAAVDKAQRDRTELEPMEYKVTCKDGTVRDIRFSMAPMGASSLVIFYDITERKQAEMALRESEERFGRALENIPDVVVIYDRDLRIQYINDATRRITGRPTSDFIGRREEEIWPPEVYEAYLPTLKEAFKTRTIRSLETNLLLPNGASLILQITCIPLIDENGEVREVLGITHDFTERKQAEAELRKLSLAVEQSPNSIVITNCDANIEYVNDNFLKLTGYSRDEVIGKNPRILQSGKTPKAIYEDMWAHLDRGEAWRGELINKRKDGSEYIESVQISPVRQANGRISHYLAINENITEKKKIEERIERLAHFDQLTGLPNRSLLSDRFKFALSLAQRSGEPLAVMFLDLDHFKNINDTLGHTIGDQLLMEVARRIKATLREEDTVSRLGGDEFILILPGTNADGAAHVAAKLIEAVPQPCLIGQHELITTSSIGIAIYPHDGEELETLSKNADAAMYRVKQGGRNNFRFYTPEMQEHSARTLKLANALRHAQERNELQLHYQPQFSMQDGHIVGAEALLRWRHPELGMISPGEFIPIAEDSGLIIPIGEWVLRTAAKQLKNWLDSGLPKMVMAVNLSSVQFRQANITELITHILDEVKLPHEYLELELTEAVAMGDPLAAIKVMDKLHERGIRMSIDDFGTGYSSLNYLKKFKVYKLKIDQSFVRDITDDPDDKAIVSAIINMAGSLGIQTIAEGVETAGQLDFLRMQGCDEAQGYYFSKPITAEQFEAFVKKARESQPAAFRYPRQRRHSGRHDIG